MNKEKVALCWFRRDLRLDDHAALYAAFRAADQVVPVFVFDRPILDALVDKADRRVAFIHLTLQQLQAAFGKLGRGLIVVAGDPVQCIPQLARQYGATSVWAARDYEPAARVRDDAVSSALAAEGIALQLVKDQVIFETDEVLTGSRKPFQVFTPYKNAWLKQLSPFYVQPYPSRRDLHRLMPMTRATLPSLGDLGFAPVDLRLEPGPEGAEGLLADFMRRMAHYQTLRDYPASKGVSYLSVHLRFGTISIRQLVAMAWHQGDAGAQTWLSELIWREFYQMLIWHYPESARMAFKPNYRGLVFPDQPDWFTAWCAGQTGYPIVDAAMRQLNQTGYMHNRLRMIAASFLVKDLLIDWRQGEAYFAAKLLDYDLAANVGGWQWSASTGCDAQPYFRIFNPVSQSEKFDAEGKFIRRYVPELAALSDRDIHAPWLAKPLALQAAGIVLGQHYPHPIVDHAVQREKALALFKAARTGD